MLLTACFAALASSFESAAPDAAAPLPVLLVTGDNNHDWKWTTPKIKELLERTGRFVVDVTETPETTLADAAALAKYRCFVLNYNNTDPNHRWGEAADKNFLAAVSGGTGVTVIHAADNAFKGFTEYEKLVADLWRDGTSHGTYHPFDVKMSDRDHPITRDLPDLKDHPDELYHKLVHTPGIATRVLATAFSDPKEGGTGNDEPMVIVLNYGKGRVFHTPLGHAWVGVETSHATWADPMLDVLIARGTEWAATGDVTLPPRPVNELTTEERAAGFKLLFDGATGAGWRAYRGTAFPAKGWSIEQGALHVVKGGGGGDLVTQDEYADFELRFEWKVAPGSNSGVMYRTGEALDTPWQTAPEYQILDDELHPDGKQKTTSAGSLYALYPPQCKVLNPVGEWNTGRIRVRGESIEHWLNDKLVVECKLGSDGWKKRVSESKFATMPQFGTLATGRLCLQDHGDDVWFRSLRVRDLSH